MKIILTVAMAALLFTCLAACKDEPKQEQSAGAQGSNALQDYQNKAKTTEAIDMLDMINKGAIMYFTAIRVDQHTGEMLPCQFPESQEATPGPKGCKDKAVDSDGDGRCDPNLDAWSTPTWSALSFELVEPHYFVYSFHSEGTGGDARYTISAHADLDGDGILSTFQRSGKAVVNGDSCSVQMDGALFMDNELE